MTYEELFLAADTIAERVPSLDAYAIGGLGTFARTAGLPEIAAPMAQEDYVRVLIEANRRCSRVSLQSGRLYTQ